MSDNFIIGAANRAVSENMRFLRQYEANPQAMIDAANASQTQGQGQMDAMMQFMMLLMMMQLMGGQTGANANDFFDTFPDYRDLVQTNTGGSGNTQTGTSNDENPAEEFLSKTPEEGQSFADMLKAEIEKGTFNRKQLRQALTAQALQTQDAEASQKALDAINALIEDHVLNPLPFMQETFLNRLNDDQYSHLLTSVSKAGMPLNANGITQPAFLSHVMTTLSGDEETSAHHFVSHFIALCGERYGEANNAQGEQIRHLMALTGIHPETDEEETANV